LRAFAEHCFLVRIIPRASVFVVASLVAGSALAQPYRPQPASPVAPAPATTPAAPAPVSTPAATPTPAAPVPAAAPAPAAAAPTEEQRAAAREAYTRGQALFAQSKFADARVAFQEAYDAVPNPVVLFSIGECQLRLGNFEEAHATFTQYLAERPDAPERKDVEAKLAEIGAMPAMLILTSAPAGAAIRVDGVDTGKLTPAEVELPRGEHKLELTLAGHTAISEGITAKAGVRHELHAELQPLPPPPPPKVVEAPPPPPPAPEPPTEAIWLTSILGATGLVTGTVLGFMALAERSDYDANPTAESADRGERLALFADVAFGIGAISALTAVVLYATGDEPVAPPTAEGESARSGGHWSLAPVVAPGHVGLASEGRF
jgi:hypothetical protein